MSVVSLRFLPRPSAQDWRRKNQKSFVQSSSSGFTAEQNWEDFLITHPGAFLCFWSLLPTPAVPSTHAVLRAFCIQEEGFPNCCTKILINELLTPPLGEECKEPDCNVGKPGSASRWSNLLQDLRKSGELHGHISSVICKMEIMLFAVSESSCNDEINSRHMSGPILCHSPPSSLFSISITETYTFADSFAGTCSYVIQS